MKEGLKDSVTTSYIWWGREEVRSLYDTRFVVAIYEAISSNRHFEKPSRSEFQAQVRETLRTAKECFRSRMRHVMPSANPTQESVARYRMTSNSYHKDILINSILESSSPSQYRRTTTV